MAAVMFNRWDALDENETAVKRYLEPGMGAVMYE